MMNVSKASSSLTAYPITQSVQKKNQASKYLVHAVLRFFPFFTNFPLKFSKNQLENVRLKT